MSRHKYWRADPEFLERSAAGDETATSVAKAQHEARAPWWRTIGIVVLCIVVFGTVIAIGDMLLPNWLLGFGGMMTLIVIGLLAAITFRAPLAGVAVIGIGLIEWLVFVCCD